MPIIRILQLMRNALYLLSLLLTITSCLRDMPEELPGEVSWNPELAFPLGRDRFTLAESGFDTTLFGIDSLTSLPWWVDSVDLVLEGRIDFDMGSLDVDIGHVKRILFRLGLWNGFPDEALVQAYFYGAGGAGPIDSLFTEGPILLNEGSPVGIGDSIIPSHLLRDAVVEQERVAPLSASRLILFRARVPEPATDTSLIPYYPLYHLDAEAGCMLELELNIE